MKVFIKDCGYTVKGLDQLIQDAKQYVERGGAKEKLVWLELTGCSGNIISLLDGANPGLKYLITNMVDLVYEQSLIAAEGQEAMNTLMSVLDDGFILAVEGAVSTRDDGIYNIIGLWNDEPITALKAIKLLGPKAKYVIAVGACASHGGVSGATPNPSQCVSVQKVLNRKVIQLPGCPCHPDWFLGTLASLIMYGEPELDNMNRPLMFYATLIHDNCPRRSYFDKGIFAEKLSEKTCMFKLGCRGPITPIDCPIRKWNQYVNWPIGDDTPCIGCAQFGFPDKMSPFINYGTIGEVKND